ncbi:MAG: class I SAM-dependent methyltransferase [Dorea sp.]|nr:class I SAM-dependent methyltransferase [Dorea sp.]
MGQSICRYCGAELKICMTDLGVAPLSNDYLANNRLSKGQHTLPLKVFYCDACKLVQVVDYEMPEGVFNEEYKYYSSFSTSWLKHSENYVDYIVKRLELTNTSKVMEIASNDGYLLQYFKKYQINPLGIEPSTSTAEIAKSKGIETIDDFFGATLAEKLVCERDKFDLIIGNNVLAHVPYIGDFVKGLSLALKESGTITLEFPHLLNLIKYNQFDTIYHEHFSYLDILSVKRIFHDNGMKIYDIQKLDTHGGSLRVFISHKANANVDISEAVENIINEELAFGLDKVNVYKEFHEKVKNIKLNIWAKLINLKKNKKTIVGYGAAAKGNTLFNYCGIKNDIIDYVADISPFKQNLYLPGSFIPVVSPERIKETKPDYVLIIPWNLKTEIISQLSYIREWGGRFLVLIPEITEL